LPGEYRRAVYLSRAKLYVPPQLYCGVLHEAVSSTTADQQCLAIFLSRAILAEIFGLRKRTMQRKSLMLLALVIILSSCGMPHTPAEGSRPAAAKTPGPRSYPFAGPRAAREFGENVDPLGTPFRIERVNI